MAAPMPCCPAPPRPFSKPELRPLRSLLLPPLRKAEPVAPLVFPLNPAVATGPVVLVPGFPLKLPPKPPPPPKPSPNPEAWLTTPLPLTLLMEADPREPTPVGPPVPPFESWPGIPGVEIPAKPPPVPVPPFRIARPLRGVPPRLSPVLPAFRP